MRLRLVLLGLLALLAVPSGTAAATPALDVLIAMDTTGSMGQSIRQAQRDAGRLVAAVKKQSPAARFAVVQFKDKGETPEYELMQTMTSKAQPVAGALAKLSAGGGGDNPEALNVIFRNSWADTRIGWRAQSRKVVVVISDAEPHGAATARVSGCLDASPDPHDLNVATELRGMRRAQRALLMIRQASTATVALQCYQSLAAAAYPGGAARDGGADLVAAIQSMIRRVLSITPKTTTQPKPKTTTRPRTTTQPRTKTQPTSGDTTAPRVTALRSSGYRGTMVKLLYRVTDDSGRSSERMTVYDGARVLTKSGWAAFGPASGKTFYFDFPAPSSLAGTFRFCVWSRDPSGNVSRPSCAYVTVG